MTEKKSYDTSEELEKGQEINTAQISKIFDTYIIISNEKLEEDGTTTGIIEFVGKKQTQEMKDVVKKCIQQNGKKPFIFAQRNLQDGVYSL